MRLITYFLAITASTWLVTAEPSLGDPSEDPRHPDYSPMPAHLVNREAEKRDVVGFYMCAGLDWAKPCYWQEVQLGTCYAIDNTGPSYGFGSFGPDKGIKCKVYDAIHCDGSTFMNAESDWIHYPGNAKTQTYRLLQHSVWDSDLVYEVQTIMCTKDD